VCQGGTVERLHKTVGEFMRSTISHELGGVRPGLVVSTAPMAWLLDTMIPLVFAASR
jgi:hypothetical protein